MSRRRVAKGREARNRRYVSAVRRQLELYSASPVTKDGRQVWYVEPTEMLRPGHTIKTFAEVAS